MGQKRSRERERSPRPPVVASRPEPGRWTLQLQQVLASRWFLGAVLVLAAGLRLTHILALRSTVYFDNLDLDPLSYDRWGQNLAAGKWLGDKLFFVDPLYAYFLGIIYKSVGRDFLVLRLLQGGLGVGTCLLTARLGRSLFGAARGNFAAFLLAIYKPAIFYEAEVEKTVLAVFLLTATFLFLVRPTVGSRVLAGAGLGLAALARANLFLLAPVVVAFLFFERRDCAALPRQARSFGMAAALLSGFLLILVPVLWRNHHVGGEWAVTTSAGQNFYIGNNPLNDTGGYCFLPFVRPTPVFEEEDFRATAQARVGHRLSAGEVSTFWFRQAFYHLGQQPAFAAKMVMRKVVLLLNDYELPDNQDMYFLGRSSLVLRLPLLTFGWLFPLALLGMATTLRHREEKLLVILLGIFGASIVAFFVQARFRMPMVPVLTIFASSGLCWLLAKLRAVKWRPAALAGALLLGAGGFCFHLPATQDRQTALALSWQNLGVLHSRLGRFDDAIAAYRKSLEVIPSNVFALRDLGVVYLELRRFAEAEEVLRACLKENPGLGDAWYYLGRVHAARGALAPAMADYRRALRLQPDNREAARALAALRQPTGEPVSDHGKLP